MLVGLIFGQNLIYDPCMFCAQILNKGTIGPVNLEHWLSGICTDNQTDQVPCVKRDPWKPSDLICLWHY